MNITTQATAHRMYSSPRASVAFSFLDSLHWLRTKLHALFTGAAQFHPTPLPRPQYRTR